MYHHMYHHIKLLNHHIKLLNQTKLNSSLRSTTYVTDLEQNLLNDTLTVFNFIFLQE